MPIKRSSTFRHTSYSTNRQQPNYSSSKNYSAKTPNQAKGSIKSNEYPSSQINNPVIGNPPIRRRRLKGVNISKLIFLVSSVSLIFCIIIYNCTSLTALSDQTSKLKKKLENSKTENIQLKYQYEKVYSASVVEQYAQSNLGMTIMDKNYIEYVEIPTEDKVELPLNGSETDIFITSKIAQAFKLIVEYLN